MSIVWEGSVASTYPIDAPQRIAALTSTLHERRAPAVALFDVATIAQPGVRAWTTSDDGARAATMPDARGRGFLAARAVMRAMLAVHGVDPWAEILYGTFGKPYVAEARDLRFSISHSGTTACVAIGFAGEIGVDIERCGECSDADAVVRRFFSRLEAAALDVVRPERRRRAFYEVWTRREAVLKTAGIGLGVDAEAFSLTVPPAPPALIAAPDVRFARALSMYEIGSGDVVGTLVVETGGVPPPERIDAATLLLSPPRSTDRPDPSPARARAETAA